MARAESNERTVLLMADDDPADCLLTEKALRRAEVTCPLYVVHDGAELLDYLKRRGDYADPEAAPRPSLILLDLNMPKINGTEVLEQLRDEPELRRIPVVVLTTSDEERDIAASYALGANAYMVKPSAFDEDVLLDDLQRGPRLHLRHRRHRRRDGLGRRDREGPLAGDGAPTALSGLSSPPVPLQVRRGVRGFGERSRLRSCGPTNHR